MTTISACLIVYHEEQQIAACIESFADVVDEIVVVHDGPCSDRTLEIAKRYTDFVRSTEERCGSAELLRPEAISFCTGAWILVIDADERLTNSLRESLRSLIAGTDADAIAFNWRYCSRKGATLRPNPRSRKKFIFRKSQIYTIGLPHMTPETYGPCERTNFFIDHYHEVDSWRSAFTMLWRKNRRRGRAAARVLHSGIDNIAMYNATLDDDRVKNGRKIRLISRHPIVAMLVVPGYGFLYWYVVRRYWLAGITGIYDALNLPIFYFFFAYYALRLRIGRDPGVHGALR